MGRAGRHDSMLMYYLLYTHCTILYYSSSRERERGKFVDRGAAATLVITFKIRLKSAKLAMVQSKASCRHGTRSQ